jgi:probable rRNA maturation factor
MPEREQRLRVLVADERGRPVAVRGLAAWLRRVAPARARGFVCVALVSDRLVRALNRAYRHNDCATDVLSFPNVTSPPRNSRPPRTSRSKPTFSPASSVSSVVEGFLGDIVIARGVARRQARDAGHSERTELRVLALHGLLHLLGYDHEQDNGRMLRIERRLRRKGGLHEGLIERARPSTLREAQSRPEDARGTTSSRRVGRRHARGEPFGSPLILSPPKGKRLAQDSAVKRRAHQ